MTETQLRQFVREVANETKGNIVVADFAVAVARKAIDAEREACAALCMTFVDTHEANRGRGPEICAEAIRSRSNE